MARRGLVVLVEAGLGIVLRRRCPCSCLHLADLDEAGPPWVQRRLREFSLRQTWLSESPPRLATYCVWWQTKFLLAGNRKCNFIFFNSEQKCVKLFFCDFCAVDLISFSDLSEIQLCLGIKCILNLCYLHTSSKFDC